MLLSMSARFSLKQWSYPSMLKSGEDSCVSDVIGWLGEDGKGTESRPTEEKKMTDSILC